MSGVDVSDALPSAETRAALPHSLKRTSNSSTGAECARFASPTRRDPSATDIRDRIAPGKPLQRMDRDNVKRCP